MGFSLLVVWLNSLSLTELLGSVSLVENISAIIISIFIFFLFLFFAGLPSASLAGTAHVCVTVHFVTQSLISVLPMR